MSFHRMILRFALSFLCVCVVIGSAPAFAQESPAGAEPRLFPAAKDGKWGYIDSTGKVVLPLRYDGANPFSEGLAAVRVGRKWGYIDRTGEIVIQPEYGIAGFFHNGLAGVRMGFIDCHRFIDRTGKVVVAPIALKAGGCSEGLIPVQMELLGQGRKWGYMDMKGELVIKAQFDNAGEFNNGLAQVKLKDKWGCIDRTGAFVIKPQFDNMLPFEEGLALVQVGKKLGCIDSTGAFVIQPRFDISGLFIDGSGGGAGRRMEWRHLIRPSEEQACS